MPDPHQTDSQIELAGHLRYEVIEGGFWTLDLLATSPALGDRVVLVGADAEARAAGDGARVVVRGAHEPDAVDFLMAGHRFTVDSLEVQA